MSEKNSVSRSEMMLNDPVNRLVPRLAAPSIVSMLVSSIYNMADTFYVSQIGTSASGAVGIIFSAMAMIQAFSFMMGIGTSNNVSRSLGAGDEDLAKRFTSVGWFTTFAMGLVIAVLGTIFMHPLVMLLGSTETIAPYAEGYARFIFICAPFMMASFYMNNLLRYQGLSTYAMVGITTGGILNIILDPIFIFILGLGTSGAGMATGLSQFISFCILLFMCQTRREAIKIRFSDFRPSKKIFWNIFYTGMPSLGRQGIGSLSNVLLNNIAGVYGDAAIAAMSITLRFSMFLNSVVIGFGQGFQPVCSFNYGAKKYDRVRNAYWFSVRVATIFFIIVCLICLPFARNIIMLFRRDDAVVIAIGTVAVCAQLITMPLWGFYNMSNMLTQSIGYGVRALLIASARQGIFLILMLLILPPFLGILGVEIAQPVSDVLSFLLSIILVYSTLRDIKQKGQQMAEAGAGKG